MPRRPKVSEYCGRSYLYNLVKFCDETSPNRTRVRDKALIATLFLTGGFIEEVLRLRKDNFDFNDSEAQARGAFVVKKMRLFRHWRGKQVFRTFPIFNDDPLVEFLREWLPEVDDYLFPNPSKTRPLTRQTGWRVVKKLRPRLNYKISQIWFRLQRQLYFANEFGWSKYLIQQYFKMEQFPTISGHNESWRNLLYIHRKRPHALEKTEELNFPNIILEKLPQEVKMTVQGVMFNYHSDFPRFCFWGMRTALIDAIRIRFRKDGKENQLDDEKGNVRTLTTWIDLAKKERYISGNSARFLKGRTKVFGDISSHDYMADMHKEEVTSIFTQLRVALARMYYEEKST